MDPPRRSATQGSRPWRATVRRRQTCAGGLTASNAPASSSRPSATQGEARRSGWPDAVTRDAHPSGGVLPFCACPTGRATSEPTSRDCGDAGGRCRSRSSAGNRDAGGDVVRRDDVTRPRQRPGPVEVGQTGRPSEGATIPAAPTGQASSDPCGRAVVVVPAQDASQCTHLDDSLPHQIPRCDAEREPCARRGPRLDQTGQ